MKNRFSVSFINRIDNILIFNRLTLDNIREIIRNSLDKIGDNYKIKFSYSDNVIEEIVDESDYFDFGARKISKIISKSVENIVIDAIINNNDSVFISSIKREQEKNITL